MNFTTQRETSQLKSHQTNFKGKIASAQNNKNDISDLVGPKNNGLLEQL